MGVEDLISRATTQTAVYWNAGTPDGYGGETFDSAYPREIDCRWEDKTEISRSGVVREFITKAVVYVKEDVEVNGWLFLGELTDLDSDELDDPRTVDGAYMIGRFDKIPSMNGTEYVRKAYIGWQTRGQG